MFALTRQIIDLAQGARRKNLVKLEAIVGIGVDRDGNDPEAVYARVALEIFDDDNVHLDRIVAFFASMICFQRRFNIDLEKEVTDFNVAFFLDWMDCQNVSASRDAVQFCANSTFISLSIKLVTAESHLENYRFETQHLPLFYKTIHFFFEKN